MSGPQTYDKFLHRMKADTFDDDTPISTYRAWALEQNLSHLVGQYTQHRVNWCGHSSHDTAFGALTYDNNARYLTRVFPHTWLREEYPCGLDILICGKTNGSLTLDARVVPHIQGRQPFDPSAPVLWSASGTTTSATSTAIIDDIFYPGTTRQSQEGFGGYPIIQDAQFVMVGVCMSRLEILLGVEDEDDSYITRILVREFC